MWHLIDIDRCQMFPQITAIGDDIECHGPLVELILGRFHRQLCVSAEFDFVADFCAPVVVCAGETALLNVHWTVRAQLSMVSWK